MPKKFNMPIKKVPKMSIPAPRRSVWTGPGGEGPNGGITQSALARFLGCRERFRLTMVEGLRPADQFNKSLEFGQMWHLCEEALAKGADPSNRTDQWTPLTNYCQQLCRRYPLQQEEITKWYRIIKYQFPIYVDYWRRNPDVLTRTPLLQEQVFAVPYRLPSGRTVRLRGKWDAVDLIGQGKGAGIYLQENKTKGDVNEAQIKRQLSFDLQTMFYLVALDEARTIMDFSEGPEVRKILDASGPPIAGVRYNVIRRPLSGGKGTIKKHQPSKSNPLGETDEQYHARLAQYIRDEPESYFFRWKVEIGQPDLQRFRREFLDPILEQLCDWWDHIRRCALKGWSPFDTPGPVGHGCSDVLPNLMHWRHPFGTYNVLDEGGSSDLDEYLATGSEVGLVRADALFGELQP